MLWMKPSLILLPGLLCDRTVWEPQLPSLEAFAHCHVADYALADSLGAMAETVLAKAPERFAIAGHSMGGRVAFEILRRAGERVTHVALMDTRTHAKPPGEAGDKEAQGRYELLEMAQARGMRAMAEKWVQGMVHPSRLADAVLMEEILSMFERKSPDIFAAQIQALLGRPDASAVLAGIRVPALILCGREDAWSQLAWHQEMARVVPHAHLEVVEECGHMATLERPTQVARAMVSWLKRA
jgi:pimeloyl-ACP methyl ester carboxylesterase